MFPESTERSLNRHVLNEKREEPDKHRNTMAEFANGMENSSLWGSEQTWLLFRHPLLRFTKGELPPDDPDSLSVRGKLGGPSAKVSFTKPLINFRKVSHKVIMIIINMRFPVQQIVLRI
jgi:hypothetical protein